MVNVIHDQMVRSVHYLAVHFDALAAGFSHGIEIPVRTLGEPVIFAQPQVVFGIDDSELTASQRYDARLVIPRIGETRWVEVFAFLQQRAITTLVTVHFPDGPEERLHLLSVL